MFFLVETTKLTFFSSSHNKLNYQIWLATKPLTISNPMISVIPQQLVFPGTRLALQVYRKNKEQCFSLLFFAKEVIPQPTKIGNTKIHPNYINKPMNTKRNSPFNKKTVHDYVYIILH